MTLLKYLDAYIYFRIDDELNRVPTGSDKRGYCLHTVQGMEYIRNHILELAKHEQEVLQLLSSAGGDGDFLEIDSKIDAICYSEAKRSCKKK